MLAVASPLAVVTPILATVFGLVIGSFLNVVIYRVPRELSVVSPPSACPGCASEISARDNVPVISWLALRGRCRNCGMRISARYPLVEAATAALFLVTALRFPVVASADDGTVLAASIVALVAFLYLMAISVALSAIDLELHRLPNSIVLPSYGVGVLLLGAASLLAGDLESIARAAAGAGVLFVFYLVLALAKPGGMGLGDVKLAGVIGLYLGWLGWGPLVVGVAAAFVLGGIVGIVLILIRRATRSSGIPFGPWMLAGAWVGILAGQELSSGYLSLVGIS